MNPKLPIAAITDEFTPELATALDAMKTIGMDAAELRMIGAKNIMDLDQDELERARDLVQNRGFHVVSIASPVMKCVLPDAPAVDTRWQQDAFASKHTYEDQDRLAERAFAIAQFFGAKIVRVFSYWRTVQPEATYDRVGQALRGLAEKAAREDLIIGLENEHACNVATASEAAKILNAVDHPNLKLVWDPANALVAGENPFPEGYGTLPKGRIAHVHAKDCHMEAHTPVWGPVGTRHVDWKGQISALLNDGYTGYLSLETHWAGPGGDKVVSSTICGWNLRGLASA